MAKAKDLVLEVKQPQRELSDAFMGELFQPKARNHYEENDGVPVAPHVDVKRPTVRQRVENLLRRGVDPLAHYVGTEGIEMEVPDDPESPLTPSEENYLDALSEHLAEAAPLPDEGLPRSNDLGPPADPKTPPGGPGGAPGGVPAADPGAAAPPAKPSTVPSR